MSVRANALLGNSNAVGLVRRIAEASRTFVNWVSPTPVSEANVSEVGVARKRLASARLNHPTRSARVPDTWWRTAKPTHTVSLIGGTFVLATTTPASLDW